MQINTTIGFDVRQVDSFWCVIIAKNGATRIVGIIVLTGKHRPAQHRADQNDKHQRQRQQ